MLILFWHDWLVTSSGSKWLISFFSESLITCSPQSNGTMDCHARCDLEFQVLQIHWNSQPSNWSPKTSPFPHQKILKTGHHHHPKIRKFAGFQADDQVHNAVLRACATAGLYKRAIYIINRIIEVPGFAGVQPEVAPKSPETLGGKCGNTSLYKLWMFTCHVWLPDGISNKIWLDWKRSIQGAWLFCLGRPYSNLGESSWVLGWWSDEVQLVIRLLLRWMEEILHQLVDGLSHSL